jgi:hypothetical protein
MIRRRDNEENHADHQRATSEPERKKYEVKKIDFSNIPELSDKQLSRMRRVGRPTVGDEPRKPHRDSFRCKGLGVVAQDCREEGIALSVACHEILAKEMRKAS